MKRNSMNCGQPSAIQYLSERDLGCVCNVDPIPLEGLVRFVSHSEDNIGRNGRAIVVALPLKRDFSTGLPSGPDIDGQHFVLLLVALAICAQPLS